jgi:hypothetical protein
MSEAIPPLPQYAFMALCLVKKKKAKGQLYLILSFLLLLFLSTYSSVHYFRSFFLLSFSSVSLSPPFVSLSLYLFFPSDDSAKHFNK